jgi:hypothetical protein
VLDPGFQGDGLVLGGHGCTHGDNQEGWLMGDVSGVRPSSPAPEGMNGRGVQKLEFFGDFLP